jgi:hypothetical protein
MVMSGLDASLRFKMVLVAGHAMAIRTTKGITFHMISTVAFS